MTNYPSLKASAISGDTPGHWLNNPLPRLPARAAVPHRPESWSTTRAVISWGLSRSCAFIVFIADAFVFAMMWVPHKTTSEAAWWVVPVVAMIITVLGFVYWSSLVGYRKLCKTGEVFLIDRKPRSEHIEECQRDVLVSEWLEQKWLSQATGTGPEVFLKRLKKREQSDPNVSNTSDLAFESS